MKIQMNFDETFLMLITEAFEFDFSKHKQCDIPNILADILYEEYDYDIRSKIKEYPKLPDMIVRKPNPRKYGNLNYYEYEGTSYFWYVLETEWKWFESLFVYPNEKIEKRLSTFDYTPVFWKNEDTINTINLIIKDTTNTENIINFSNHTSN